MWIVKQKMGIYELAMSGQRTDLTYGVMYLQNIAVFTGCHGSYIT